jgi:hypothetical protein
MGLKTLMERLTQSEHIQWRRDETEAEGEGEDCELKEK